jgi:hypothetical protein
VFTGSPAGAFIRAAGCADPVAGDNDRYRVAAVFKGFSL